jgi:hypothetical protein
MGCENAFSGKRCLSISGFHYNKRLLAATFSQKKQTIRSFLATFTFSPWCLLPLLAVQPATTTTIVSIPTLFSRSLLFWLVRAMLFVKNCSKWNPPIAAGATAEREMRTLQTTQTQLSSQTQVLHESVGKRRMKRALLVTEMARLETLIMGKERQQATTRRSDWKRYAEDCICFHAIEAGILQGYSACFWIYGRFDAEARRQTLVQLVGIEQQREQ